MVDDGFVIDDEVWTKEEAQEALKTLMDDFKQEIGDTKFKPIPENVDAACRLFERIRDEYGGTCDVRGRLFSPTLTTGYIRIFGEGITIRRDFIDDLPEIVQEIEIDALESEPEVVIQFGLHKLGIIE